jgi:hypothetical protein
MWNLRACAYVEQQSKATYRNIESNTKKMSILQQSTYQRYLPQPTGIQPFLEKHTHRKFLQLVTPTGIPERKVRREKWYLRTTHKVRHTRLESTYKQHTHVSGHIGDYKALDINLRNSIVSNK